jgi:hypothetical protein
MIDGLNITLNDRVSFLILCVQFILPILPFVNIIMPILSLLGSVSGERRRYTDNQV